MATTRLPVGVTMVMFLTVMSDAAKVLLIPTSVMYTSRIENLEKLGAMLIDGGHEVHFLSADAPFNASRNKGKLIPRLFPFPEDLFVDFDDQQVQQLLAGDQSPTYKVIMYQQLLVCEAFLRTSLLGELKADHFDVVIMDLMDSCARLVVDYLDVPTMVFSNLGFHPNPTMIFPEPLAYVPAVPATFTTPMTFLQRVQNVVMFWGLTLVRINKIEKPLAQLRAKYSLNTTLPVSDFFTRTSLVVCITDFVFDYPRPLLPHVITLEGILDRPAKPLPNKLEEFVSQSEHGIVVASFGTHFAHVSQDVTELMAGVFSQLKQRVVWRYSGPVPRNLGKNTLTMDWLPQNDLLGHNKTRLFVTHCGASSSQEALYHGNPVVALPLMFDQYHMATKLLDRHHMGVLLDFRTITAETFSQAINNVLLDARYRENALRASALRQDKPMSGRDTLVYWVEYLVRHGHPEHLQPTAARDLYWFQYCLLDVVLFVMLVVMVTLGVPVYLIYKIARCCCRRTSNTSMNIKQKEQ